MTIKKYFLLILISWCCLLTVETSFAINISKESYSSATNTAISQQQLDTDTAQITTISNALQQQRPADNTLLLMQQQVEGVITRAHQLQQAAEKKANEINSLISALGPAPKEGEAAEDLVTAEKRAQLNEQLATYNGQVKQAAALISQSMSLSNALAQQRLQNKAKGLLQRSLPLYAPIIWEKGFAKSDDAMAKAWNNTITLFSKSVLVLKDKTVAILFFTTSLLTSFFGFFLYWILIKNYGQRFVTAKPSLFRRFISTVANIIATGLIPFSVVLLIVFYAKKYQVIYEAQAYILNCFILMVVFIWLSYLLIKNILSPHYPNWRILTIKDDSAKPLAKLLMLFV
ncbi:MAG: hypothetical protein ACK4PR_13365, partial [Gammaproteobacteria bacterium]